MKKITPIIFPIILFFTIFFSGIFLIYNTAFKSNFKTQASIFSFFYDFFSNFKKQEKSQNSANIVLVSQPEINTQTLPELKITEKKIEINLKEQKMYLWQDGKIINQFLVSSGRKGRETKTGNFSVIEKLPMAFGCSEGQCWKMPYWMKIYPANGIHELPFITNNGGRTYFREGQSSLGHPVSHGCIRLGIGNAEKVYNWTATGTPVIIHR